MRAMVGLVAVKMAFTGGAAHHQRARPHQARPQAPNANNERVKSRAYPDQQILIEQEKRLYGANLANRVPYDEIAVVELRMECILDQLVVSMILALVRERDLPAQTLSQIVALDDFETQRKSDRLELRDPDRSLWRGRCS